MLRKFNQCQIKIALVNILLKKMLACSMMLTMIVWGYFDEYLSLLRTKNFNRLIIVHININSIRNNSARDSIEGFFTELNLKRKEIACMLLLQSIPHLNFGTFEHLDLTGNYGSIFLMGDFNCAMVNVDDMDFYNLSPTCINLMLTNSCKSFLNSCVIITEFLDFRRVECDCYEVTLSKAKTTNYKLSW